MIVPVPVIRGLSHFNRHFGKYFSAIVFLYCAAILSSPLCRGMIAFHIYLFSLNHERWMYWLGPALIHLLNAGRS
jgi:hypothetical protein